MHRKTTPEPVLIDVNGIAMLLRVSPRTARRLVREPEFPRPVRLRGCIRWWKRDVLDYVRKLSGGGGTPMPYENSEPNADGRANGSRQ